MRPWRSGRRVAFAALLAGIALVAIACGNDSDDENNGDGAILSVVASTTIVEDLVRQVGGDRVTVESIVPQGADAHTFTLSPSDIRKTAEADLYVFVGASLAVTEENLEQNAEGATLELTHDMDLRPFPEGLAHADHDEGDADDHDEGDADDHDEGDADDHDEGDADDHDEGDADDHDEGDADDHDEGDADDHDEGDADDHDEGDADDHDEGDADDHDEGEADDHDEGDADDHDEGDADDHDEGDADDHDEGDADDHDEGDADDHDEGDADDHDEGEAGHDDHGHGEFDPHFWMDVDHTIEAVEAIRDELSRLDPEGADGYRDRATQYIAELREVDEEIRELLTDLPEERRYLVTFHDAFGYFAERYGLTILGFVVEGPEEEPSASALSELVESITEFGIPFIFTEPQFSARVIEQIARDTGATVRTIPSGALSEEYPTYVEFLRAIATAIAD